MMNALNNVYADARRMGKHQFYKHYYGKRSTVMLHFGRTGSSVLCNQFEQHPDIDWATEIYEEYQRSRNPDWDTTDDPRKITQNLINRHKEQLFGFEVKVFRGQHLDTTFGSCTVADYIDTISGMGVTSFIVLRRNNYLRQYLSAHVGEQRNKWHYSKMETAALERILLPIRPASMNTYQAPILEFLGQMNQTYIEIEKALRGKKQLWLTYEKDVEKDPRNGYIKCCNFWGLKPMDSEILLSKATNFPLEDLVSNFSELQDELVGTEYEWMLYDF